jgi:hypothetical protein
MVLEDWMLEEVEIVPGGDEEPSTLVRFREAAGRWARGAAGGANDTIMVACDLLVEDFDTPSLRDLASFPADAGWWESRDVVKATLEELGYDFFALDGEQSRLLTLRALCRAFLSGALAQGAFLRKVIRLFGGEPPAVASDLAYLVYAFDADERELDEVEAAELTARAEAYARAFLATSSDF